MQTLFLALDLHEPSSPFCQHSLCSYKLSMQCSTWDKLHKYGILQCILSFVIVPIQIGYHVSLYDLFPWEWSSPIFCVGTTFSDIVFWPTLATIIAYINGVGQKSSNWTCDCHPPLSCFILELWYTISSI
jgi:hypothetical protein